MSSQAADFLPQRRSQKPKTESTHSS